MEMIRYRIMRLTDGSLMEVDDIQGALRMSAIILQDTGNEVGTALAESIRDTARANHAESEYWTGELSEQELYEADMATEGKLTDEECMTLWAELYASHPEAKDLLAVYCTDLTTGAYQYERMFVGEQAWEAVPEAEEES